MNIHKFISLCIAGVLALMPLFGQAQYAHFETPDAHIVVARPMDRWSLNKSWQALTIQTHFDGLRLLTLEGHYRRNAEGKEADEIAFVKGKDQVSEALRSNLALRNLKSANGAYAFYQLRAPVRLSHEQLVEFQETKAKSYLTWASAQSPGVAQRNDSIAQAAGTAVEFGLGVAATVLTGGIDLTSFFAGASGAVRRAGNMTFHAGRNWDIPVGYFVPALPAPTFDFAPYKNVDYRSISLGRGNDMLHGEFYIAYKNEKTPEAENEALIVALTEVMAVNSTKEQIQAARQSELNLRVKIWEECVASGACKG